MKASIPLGQKEIQEYREQIITFVILYTLTQSTIQISYISAISV